MKFLFPDKHGVVHLDTYFSYLTTIREKLPQSVYMFATNPEYYHLSSKASLHDAWLESCTIREMSSGKRQENRGVALDLCFLGAYHDRKHHLSYEDVVDYSIMANSLHNGHGDVFVHEVRLSDTGHVLHEWQFCDGHTISIACRSFQYTQEMLDKNDAE